MTELRQRMIECLQLRGLSARPQAMYVRAVRQLAEPYHKPPDVITEEARRQYFLSIKHGKPYARRASTMALCGLTFCFEYPLPSDWTTLPFVRAPRENKLPVILRPDEGRTLLGRVRLLRSRVGLSTLDSCGLRLQEGTHLQGRDSDRSRRMLHVRPGKGGKDRDGPRPPHTRELLRHYGVTHRQPRLLFPAPGRGRAGLASATKPMPKSSLPEACRQALTQSGIHQQASGPTRRHS